MDLAYAGLLSFGIRGVIKINFQSLSLMKVIVYLKNNYKYMFKIDILHGFLNFTL